MRGVVPIHPILLAKHFSFYMSLIPEEQSEAFLQGIFAGLATCVEWFKQKHIVRMCLRFLFTVLLVLLVLWGTYRECCAPPPNAPAPVIVIIDSDETLDEIGAQLARANVIRHGAVLRAAVRILGGSRRIQPGAYLFNEPQNSLFIACRLILGDHEVSSVKVIIPEGATVREIGDMLARKLSPFNEALFLQTAAGREGYLYPDTYYFYPAQNADEIEKMMEDNFQRKLATVGDKVQASGRPFSDVLTMASIVAGEARTPQDRLMVASILWKRMSLNMPLQVDAPFGYVLDKNLTQLTHTDIATDSPYNTYTNKGLPPTPIGSPALSAIVAAATAPTTTPYLFYLSDQTGVMHYSTNFNQHRALVKKLL